MIDWCAARSGGRTAAFFAPDLHSCDHADNCMRLALNRPVYYSDHAPFSPCDESGRMDMGVSERRLWIAEYDDVPPAELPRRAESRLENGEIREVTAHGAGEAVPEEFFRLEVPQKQLSVLEMRLNAEGKRELLLYNNGGEITFELPAGEITIPAYALKTVVQA